MPSRVPPVYRHCRRSAWRPCTLKTRAGVFCSSVHPAYVYLLRLREDHQSILCCLHALSISAFCEHRCHAVKRSGFHHVCKACSLRVWKGTDSARKPVCWGGWSCMERVKLLQLLLHSSSAKAAVSRLKLVHVLACLLSPEERSCWLSAYQGLSGEPSAAE